VISAGGEKTAPGGWIVTTTCGLVVLGNAEGVLSGLRLPI